MIAAVRGAKHPEHVVAVHPVPRMCRRRAVGTGPVPPARPELQEPASCDERGDV